MSMLLPVASQQLNIRYLRSSVEARAYKFRGGHLPHKTYVYVGFSTSYEYSS